MTEVTITIVNSLSVESFRKGAPWIVVDDYQRNYTKVRQECREWAPVETNKAVEAAIVA